MEAAETQDINALYEAIASDPYIFDKEDEIPFVNTRLHVAASNGQTHLAIEIWNLKPSLSRKLDRSGLSPLHLALLNGHFEIVEGLIKLDKNLTRVKGREMLTPLHHAAAIDDRGVILTTFLLACPQSIEDLNARGETALHIAAKYCKVRALEVLMGWIRKTQKHWVVDIQDRRGNTILHTAVSTSQPDIVKSVARGCKNFKRLVNDKNLEGATAVDIAARLAPGPTRTTIESILRRGGASRRSSPAKDYSIIDYLISRETLVENMVQILYFWREAFPVEIRNTVIVVAALITTATFQAALSPPGGSGGGGDPGDNSYISGKVSYINANISQINATISTSTKSDPTVSPQFDVSNTIAFVGSICLITLVLPSKVFVPLYYSLLFLALSYMFASTLYSAYLIVSTLSILGTVYFWTVHFYGADYKKVDLVRKNRNIYLNGKRLEMLHCVLRS